ncbi:hypothetical protein [Algihabitans albus]|uniref:hypothetical protein n=1 Tax=Algihabitans albus TaxID=2164067 RepID=UPI0038B26059
MAQGGRTIAAIGTHIGRAYRSGNARLQDEIATKHLVIPQVPVLRYKRAGAGLVGDHRSKGGRRRSADARAHPQASRRGAGQMNSDVDRPMIRGS